MIAAVGGVKIHEDIGIPGVEHREGRSSLRCLRFYVITIEIQVLRVCPGTDQRRAVLVRAVARLVREALVPVGVVDGNRNEDYGIERVWLWRKSEITYQRQQRILSLHFPAVDVALNVDDRTLQLSCLCWSGDRGPGCYDVWNIPPLRRLPDRPERER
jgi:hypothetical protein